MKVILTGATGMVGEGVLLECLENPAVEQVLSVSRRTCGGPPEALRAPGPGLSRSRGGGG